MKILAIGSHPDDIEFGCGGTLLKYAGRGHEVILYVLSDGGRGGDSDTRRREQEIAAESLGAKELIWGDFEDTHIPESVDLIKAIESVISKVEPTLIFVHFGDDTHQDHRNLSTCTVTATRYIQNVLFYEGPTSQNFHPTVFVDIGNSLDGKVKSLMAHTSQVGKTNIEELSIVDIEGSLAHFRGIQGRVTQAEGFVPLRLFIAV